MNVSRKGFIEGSALAMAGLGLTACSGGDKGAEAEAEASQNTVNALKNSSMPRKKREHW